MLLRKKGLIAIISMSLILNSCATKNKVADDDFSVDGEESMDLGDSSSSTSSSDEIDDFDKETDSSQAATSEAPAAAAGDDISLDDSGSAADDLTLDEGNASAKASSTPAQKAQDEFSEFDSDAGAQKGQNAAPGAPVADNELSLEDDLTNMNNQAAAQPTETTAIPDTVPMSEKTQNPDPLSDMAPPPSDVAQSAQAVPSPVLPEQGAALDQAGAEGLVVTPSDANAEAEPTGGQVGQISELLYKGNDNGGTVVISSNQPLRYTTRVNSSTNQIVVEVQDVVIPNKLKRPLITKDMTSSIGTIDVYQKENSKIARFVIQLRPNSPEPLIQPEGNSLLIVGSAVAGAAKSQQQVAEQQQPSTSEAPAPTPEIVNSSGESASAEPVQTAAAQAAGESTKDLTSEGIMSSTDLEDFLANNNKFYGRKISIETTDMDLRDALKFISEESGINMVFDDDVDGKVSVKLRQVPWDQALIIMLKTKKLAYKRQGSVLRIGKVDTIVKEDEDAIKLREAKSTIEPLIVKNFPINYADIATLESKIKEFIADTKKDSVNRGRVTTDARTNMMIVTETATKLKQVEQLLKALDTQPQQVTIEAKIIEASESFTRSVGFKWDQNNLSGNGVDPRLTSNIWGKDSANPLNISPALASTPGVGTDGIFAVNMRLGTLGIFGTLDATLALAEAEEKVKILSSPRVTVLTNTAAKISQGAIVQVPSTSTTSTGTGTITQTSVPIQVGVDLSVTPQVSNIGTVKLNIQVSRKSKSAGSTDVGNRDIQTQVIVRNSETAIIGGVFQSDVSISKSGVPGLRDIPILGTLFRGESEGRTKTELMIFVTPKIVQPLDGSIMKASNTLDTAPGSMSEMDAAPSPAQTPTTDTTEGDLSIE